MPEKNRIVYFKEKYPNIPELLLLQNFPSQFDIPTNHSDIAIFFDSSILLAVIKKSSSMLAPSVLKGTLTN